MAVNKNNPVKVNRNAAPWRWPFPSPGICYLCSSFLKQEDFFLCADCKNDFPLNDRACPVCAVPVTGNMTLCGSCLQARVHPVEKSLALLRYVYPVNRLIHDLKFNGRIEIARFLGRWMARYASARGMPVPEGLVPVPLHRSRVRERGYNQSLEIARVIGGHLNIPVFHDSCRRIINTPPQSAVSAALRGQNLRGAFALAGRWKLLPGHVALIDDVITTGSTVNELARLLRDNGIGRVDAWASARTEKSAD
ncbi:MAG: ComF family protein [Gammaproteobacteria bacterium]